MGAFRLCKATPRKKVTDTSTLEKMPSLTCCEEMQDIVQKGKYGAVSSNVGTFDKKSLDIICKIHELRDISMRVKEEKSWLRKEMSVPNGKCSISKEDMARYEELIFNSPDGHAVLDNNNFILSSDLATIAGRRWLHYSILAGITKILQSTNKQRMVFMLNDLLQMRTKDLRQVVHEFAISSVRCITFFAHVFKSRAGEVQFSTPQEPGCHWTLLYVDLTTNKWFYCDTAGWTPPKDVKKLVSPIVELIYEEANVGIKSFKGLVQGHVEEKSQVSHVCSCKCLPNIPLQTCGNVCGVAVIFLAAIASCAPKLWRDVFLVNNAKFPDDLKWILHPTFYSDFMRSKVISWLLENRVEVASLGIIDSQFECKEAVSGMNVFPDSAGPGDRSRHPKRFLKEDIDLFDISDDDIKSCRSDVTGYSDTVEYSDIKSGDDTKDTTKIHRRPDTTERPHLQECDTGISDNTGEHPTEHEIAQEPVEAANCPDEDSTVNRQFHSKEAVPGANAFSDSEGSDDRSPKRFLEEETDVREISADDDKGCSGDDSGYSDTTERSNIAVGEDVKDTTNMQPGRGKAEAREHLEWDTANFDDISEDPTEHEISERLQDANNEDSVVDQSPDNPATPRATDPTVPSVPSANNTDSACRFYVGQKFMELEDFLNFKKSFEDANFCELYNKDARYLTSASKRVPKRVAAAKPSLKYYSLLLYCKFGGRPNASKERTRKTKSFRQGCPFEVYLSLSSDGQALEVMRVNEGHNHALTKQLYAHLPRQRAVSQEVRKDIKDALNLKANKKLLQHKLEQKSGKKITLKDISNIQQRTPSENDQNNLESLLTS